MLENMEVCVLDTLSVESYVLDHNLTEEKYGLMLSGTFTEVLCTEKRMAVFLY